MQRDIQSKRGFTHGRTTGDDNELTVMHTARHTVEIREARASAGDIARVVNLGEFTKMIRVIGQNRVDFWKPLDERDKSSLMRRTLA